MTCTDHYTQPPYRAENCYPAHLQCVKQVSQPTLAKGNDMIMGGFESTLFFFLTITCKLVVMILLELSCRTCTHCLSNVKYH
ncbi:hypothetical protein FKM82_007722 [Ascaphus truei]